MDSYLNIISLALAIAGLVPVLLPSNRVRTLTTTIGALSFIIILGVFQTYQEYTHQKTVSAVKEEIWILLTKNQKGLTFEQIHDNLYYPNFHITNTAIDSLIEDGSILNEKKDVFDKDGTKYVVRNYYRKFD